MKQRDLRTRELDDGSSDDTAQSRPLDSLRSSAGGAIATLLVLALGLTIFAAISARQPVKVAAGASATSARTETLTPAAAVPTMQVPIHGAGLPEGVEVITFAPTGPDEGWGTGGVITDPVDGFPDHSMVLRYSSGSWTQVGSTLPGVYLGGIDMVSSSEGWVMGGDSSGKSLLLHIHNGSWRQEPLPAIDPQGAPQIMAMRTPNEGWMAMANPRGDQGGVNASLLHDSGGTWSLVRESLASITGIAPVASGEAWVIGSNRNGTSSLLHVRGAKATVELTSPGNSSFSRLRMFAPNDIWIEGAMHSSTNADINDAPLDYHYDGVAWSNVDLHAPTDAQHIGIVASDTAWSFASVEPAPQDATAYGQIARIYSNASGQWKPISAPYKDLQSLAVVSTSSADVWAIGVYVVMTRLPDHNGAPSYAGDNHYVLLHYTGGVWTEYGR